MSGFVRSTFNNTLSSVTVELSSTGSFPLIDSSKRDRNLVPSWYRPRDPCPRQRISPSWPKIPNVSPCFKTLLWLSVTEEEAPMVM
jgi:hypothetical protein